MTRYIEKVITTIIYVIPYVFISLFLDAEYHTMGGYLLLSVLMITLCTYCIKRQDIKLLIAGNGLSFAISFISLQFFDLTDKAYYFKPFSIGGLLVTITVISMLVQLLAYCICTSRGKT